MGSKWIEGRVVDQRRWTDRLYSIRVDAAVEPFQAGQFGRLALEIGGEMVGRPYSFVNAPHETPHEFYYIHLDDGPLTSRLVPLVSGDRIFVAPRAAGFLTLTEVPDAEHLWLLSTGTALGPFLSILKTEDPWRRFGRVVLVHAVREAAELTYRETIDALRAARPGQLMFVPFVSREDTRFRDPGAHSGSAPGRSPGSVDRDRHPGGPLAGDALRQSGHGVRHPGRARETGPQATQAKATGPSTRRELLVSDTVLAVRWRSGRQGVRRAYNPLLHTRPRHPAGHFKAT